MMISHLDHIEYIQLGIHVLSSHFMMCHCNCDTCI